MLCRGGKSVPQRTAANAGAGGLPARSAVAYTSFRRMGPRLRRPSAAICAIPLERPQAVRRIAVARG